MLEESHHYFNKAADLLGLSERVREILITPRRVVKVEIVIESDGGQLLHFLGFRVQHSNTRGPYKGGLAVSPRAGREPCGGSGQSDDLEDRHRQCAIRGC